MILLAAFTDHTLPVLANWSQFLSGATLIFGLAGFYAHHRCFSCHRLARFQVGEHHIPVCHRHRNVQQPAGE